MGYPKINLIFLLSLFLPASHPASRRCLLCDWRAKTASNRMMDETGASGRLTYWRYLSEALINTPCEFLPAIRYWATLPMAPQSPVCRSWHISCTCVATCLCIYIYTYLSSLWHTVEQAEGLICILILSCRSPSCGPREMRNTTEQ